jgi:hypothetical protein
VREKEMQVELISRLKHLLRDEELKWRQRAKEKDLKEGDGNTKYFHLKASGRKKKNHISMMINNGTEILGDNEIIKHATEYYKGLFGQDAITDLRLEGFEGVHSLLKKIECL